MHCNQRTAMAAVILAICAGFVPSAQELPPATRLPAATSFALSTDAAADRALASPVAIELHQYRGRLSLGLRVGERLLTSTGAYELDVDQPSLEAGATVVFRSGRRDLAPPSSLLAGFISNLPRYELWLGRYDLDHHIKFVQHAGRADLNLAGIRLAGMEIIQSGGRVRTRFRESEAACGRFVLEQEDGHAELVGLGALGASSYALRTAAGSLTAEFGALKSGTVLDLRVKVGGGRVTIKLPPGMRPSIEGEVRGGQVTVAGERIAPGGRFALGPAGSQDVLRLEVDAGWVRVD